MNKKIMLTLLIVASASQTVSANQETYIGGSIGVTNIGYSGEKDGEISAGIIGKVFTGFGSTLAKNPRIYLGGEANLDLATYPNHSQNSNFNTAIGASFIPGVMLSPSTMVFGRAGIQGNRFSNTGLSIGNQFGVGVQTHGSNNWDVRGEFIRASNIVSKNDNQLLVGMAYKLS